MKAIIRIVGAGRRLWLLEVLNLVRETFVEKARRAGRKVDEDILSEVLIVGKAVLRW